MRTPLSLTAALVLALLIAGCSTFTKPDGTTERRVDPNKLEAASAAVGAGGAMFGPIGGIAATGIAGVLLALAAHFRAKHTGETTGWNDARTEAGLPVAKTT